MINPINKKLPSGISVSISGAASELDRTWKSMQQNVVISIFVIFILLTILMKSFRLPLIVLLVVPIAAAGGVMALIILNVFIKQPLDMLTMLGFIILSGVVVNNAILMVEQTVWHKKYENLMLKDCILEATKNRIRPIFMSTITSLFGLTPLLVFLEPWVRTIQGNWCCDFWRFSYVYSYWYIFSNTTTVNDRS